MDPEQKTELSIDMPGVAPKHLTEEELRAFVEALVSGVEHRPASWWDALRWKMRDVVVRITLKIPGTSDPAVRADRIGNLFHPLRSHTERLLQKNQQVHDTCAHGWIMVARIEGHAAAFIGIHLAMVLPDGRKAYESTSITLSQFEHRGLNSILREAMVKYIESIDPDPVFFSRTKNPYVISRCISEGWKQVPYGEMSKRLGINMSAREIKYTDRDGWTAFEFDPRLHKPLSLCLAKTHEQHRTAQKAHFTIRQTAVLVGGALGALLLSFASWTTLVNPGWFSARFGEDSISATTVIQHGPIVIAGSMCLILLSLLMYWKHQP